MPTLADIGGAIRSVDLRSTLLVIAIAIFYFLYQLIVIFSSTVGLNGDCLYTFWTPSNEWWRNPFWLVVTVVCGLIVLSLLLVIEGVRAGGKTKILTGSLSIIVLVLWLYGLNGLWNAMLFEHGEISSEVWYQGKQDGRWMILPEKEHVCNPGT